VDEGGEVLALFTAVRVQTLPSPLGAVSSRSILYAEPLCFDDARSVNALVGLIAEHDRRVRRNTLFTEIRPLYAPGPEREALERCGYNYLDYLNYVVDVGSRPEEIWQRMNRNARRAIKKAEGAGYTVHEMSANNCVEQLYSFIKLSYAHAGVPLADKSLFEAAFHHLHKKKRLTIVAVQHGTETVTMYARLTYKDMAFAWYVGTVRKPGYSPMDLLNWKDFVRCHELGFVRYDMGGAGWPDEEYGVRDYKAKFGGELVRYGRYRKISSPWKLALAERAYGVRRTFLRRKATDANQE
jgi:hypothetical protein